MERIVERAAGLDVHKDVIVAEAHLPGGVVAQGRFATTTPGLLVLRDWLVGLGVTRVGIESTGVYWKSPYYVLEDVMRRPHRSMLGALVAGTTDVGVLAEPTPPAVSLGDMITSGAAVMASACPSRMFSLQTGDKG